MLDILWLGLLNSPGGLVRISWVLLGYKVLGVHRECVLSSSQRNGLAYLESEKLSES